MTNPFNQTDQKVGIQINVNTSSDDDELILYNLIDLDANRIVAVGSTGASLATTLALVQAFTLGRFKINYEASTATQYRPDGTVLKVFDLRDKDGDPAIVAQAAVDRVPQ